jgi:hypothetical protein
MRAPSARCRRPRESRYLSSGVTLPAQGSRRTRLCVPSSTSGLSQEIPGQIWPTTTASRPSRQHSSQSPFLWGQGYLTSTPAHDHRTEYSPGKLNTEVPAFFSALSLFFANVLITNDFKSLQMSEYQWIPNA